VSPHSSLSSRHAQAQFCLYILPGDTDRPFCPRSKPSYWPSFLPLCIQFSGSLKLLPPKHSFNRPWNSVSLQCSKCWRFPLGDTCSGHFVNGVSLTDFFTSCDNKKLLVSTSLCYTSERLENLKFYYRLK
jgi:hypothetical protein